MPVYPIRRRPRECKTCHQCRASKVRCDRNVPCSNCVKRGFNCTYGRPPPALIPPRPSIASESFAVPETLGIAPQVHLPPPYPTNDEDVPYAVDPGLDDPSSDAVSISPVEWEELNNKMQEMAQAIASMKSIVQAHSQPSRPRRPTNPLSDVSGGGLRRSSTEQSNIYGSTTLKTGSVHIGNRSALHDILDQTKVSADTAEALPKDDLLAELALENDNSTYPFLDLWSSSSDPLHFNIEGVCEVLPDDNQCMKFLDYYRNIAAVLYPVLPDVDQFESNLRRLLEGRRRVGVVHKPDMPYGMSIPFLSLCFAVFASGCQLCDLPGIHREMTSWVYVSCSYQCLRVMNYVSKPTVEVIQILLIISHVLSYNMNAGASYTLLGMTERMCMVLGLHAEAPGYTPALQEARRRVWWAMAFQNSHFSLAYDRPSITMISQPEIPYDPKSMPGHRSYFETLSRILGVVLETLRILMMERHSHLQPKEIGVYIHRIRNVLGEAKVHLRDRERCLNMAESIEWAELRLHSSYYISLLCRSSLDPDVTMTAEDREKIRHDCLTNLIGTVEAFIDLHTINPFASRTWISAQRTIASAFLFIANTNDQVWPQSRDLLLRLEKVLEDHVYSDGTVNPTTRTDTAKHLSSSLEALRAVNSGFGKGKSQAKKQEAPVKGEPAPEANIPPTTQLLSSAEFASLAASMPPYQEAYSGTLEEGYLGDILNGVSGVMLFPNMNLGNP
ncbi:putative Zn(II)2Cys6 transcription factor [Aspergillus mulundensis]|uniref:Putative Zn(II)2Cys6 transcription factor n=1 Tax=Aspergillus mulundensis TaxID=1810919 RepID=A0A3D8SWM7_9EURO|nr:putative Zn(II)2Cys6 transcription factor [Aspergillus mulundensis]RDW90571.1 putative Zn(II)2Cys6 transcription factor [Aspergillus mulundensis]